MGDGEDKRGVPERIAVRAVFWLLLVFLASGAAFLLVEPALRLIGVRG
jgi:hypothetical protein